MYFGFKNVSVSYDKRHVLRDITVNIPEKKITSLIGCNGSGKSTLLKTVIGAATPDHGSPFYKDAPISEIKKSELAKRLAYLSQITPTPPAITVRELVLMGRYPHLRFGTAEKRDSCAIERALTLTGLKRYEDRLITTLSGGELQRARIAMAIAQEAEIMVLDEPTTYLDAAYCEEVTELISSLNRELGITVLMSLHDLNTAARHSDFMLALRNGTVFCFGTPGEVMTEENIREIFSLEGRVIHDDVNGCPHFIPGNAIKEKEI